MTARARFTARPRHPVTGRQLYVRAESAGELARLVTAIGALRRELAVGLKTPDEVDRILARRRPVTLERAAKSYMDAGVAPNTRRRVASALAHQFRELAPLELLELDAPRLAKWIEQLRKAGHERSTIMMHWRLLRAFVRHAAERGWITRVPWGAWRPTLRVASKRLRREAARSPGELAALLEACVPLDRQQRARGRLGGLEPKVGCAALLGLRQRELAGLRWSDVDEDVGEIAIVRQGEDRATKGGRAHVLAPTPELFEVLARWRHVLLERGLYAPDGPVFPYLEPLERSWTTAGISRVGERPGPRPYPERVECLPSAQLRRAVARAQLPNPERWTPHSLRDSFATLTAAAAGGDLQAVADRTRHASVGSLVRYLRALERARVPSPLFALPHRAALLPDRNRGDET